MATSHPNGDKSENLNQDIERESVRKGEYVGTENESSEYLPVEKSHNQRVPDAPFLGKVQSI